MAVLLLGSDTLSLEVLRFGQGEQVSWEGEISGVEGIETIAPEYRTALDPNVTEIGVAPGSLIEFENPDFPGSIMPRRVQKEQNLAVDVVERGGSISVPNAIDIVSVQLATILAGVISPEPTGNAFERKGKKILGTLIVLDLGARVGVNRVRFFPRNTLFPSPTTPFQDDFLKHFDLLVNDGLVLTDAGLPIWETYHSRLNNTQPITVIDVDPPRYLRFIRLRATSAVPFEIEKLQVFGEGFFPAAQYLSPVIDIGLPANWGRLRWELEALGNKKKVNVQIRTRTGADATPFVYNRKRVGKADAEEIPFSVDDPSAPLSRRDFLKLRPKGNPDDEWERGSVEEDLENWSPWTPPYSIEEATSEEGTRILSPGPKRYFQFRADFVSEDLESSYVLKNLSFAYTTPALADELVAEIFPREVSAATDISFVYTVRTSMNSVNLQGFNGLEIFTQGQPERIERIEIIDGNNQTIVDHIFATQDAVTAEGEVGITSFTHEGFTVRFPHIQEDNTLLKIYFVSRILTYSSAFAGRALIVGEDTFQSVVSGNAATLDEADSPFDSGVVVLSPSVARADLIGNFDLDAPVLTPNGDGVNDRLELRCEVLTVVGQAHITIEVLDLSGRRVRSLFDHKGENGVYDGARFAELEWDGRDVQGHLVPPGLYLIRLEVNGDARSSTALRTLGITY